MAQPFFHIFKEHPSLLPEGYFLQFPAIHKWFLESRCEDGNTATILNRSYLDPFRDTIVPLEYSRLSSGKSSDDDDSIFSRADAPFALFLAWAGNATAETLDRFYLAQAPVSAFPPAFQADLPRPDLVTEVGKGDIYETNLWMGLAPTYTPLHRDPNPNLLVQLAGYKIVRLLAPDDGLEIFAQVQEAVGKTGTSASFRGEEMMKGREKNLLEARIWDDKPVPHGCLHPNMGFEVRLGCGDGIYIPQGWWHSIKGIGNGITASVS